MWTILKGNILLTFYCQIIQLEFSPNYVGYVLKVIYFHVA